MRWPHGPRRRRVRSAASIQVPIPTEIEGGRDATTRLRERGTPAADWRDGRRRGARRREAVTSGETEVRITAQRLDDGRTEFGLQQRVDGEWGERLLPSGRFFPARVTPGRWLNSTPLVVSVTIEDPPDVAAGSQSEPQADEPSGDDAGSADEEGGAATGAGDGGEETGSEAEIVPYEPVEVELNELASGNEQGVYRWLGTELGYWDDWLGVRAEPYHDIKFSEGYPIRGFVPRIRTERAPLGHLPLRRDRSRRTRFSALTRRRGDGPRRSNLASKQRPPSTMRAQRERTIRLRICIVSADRISVSDQRHPLVLSRWQIVCQHPAQSPWDV